MYPGFDRGNLAAWHRWTILAMLAHAFLAVVASAERITEPATGWISLTCNEIHHLLTTLVSRPVLDVAHRLRCSRWRRRHQYRAQQGHYQRQSTREP
jgi:hypothetical protein